MARTGKSIEVATTPEPPVDTAKSGEPRLGAGRRVVVRVVALVAYTNALLFAGATPAEAAKPTTSAEASSEGWNFGSGEASTLLATLALLATAWSIRNQTREKMTDRLHAALQGIKGESSGEERLARLDALAPFAKRRKYAQEVCSASIAYLRGRRGGLLKLQRDHADNPADLENAITDRRNADRSAFKLLLETLPTVRRQTKQREFGRRILRAVHKRSSDLELQRLDELTGLRVDTQRPRVNARGINLDDMRGEVQSCNLSDTDLTGAGLQRNVIKRVSFRNSCLSEAQLEGTHVSHCGLEGTDLRAAYFGDTDYAVFENCVVDANTQFGNLPDDHPNAKMGRLEPADPNKYRGIPNVVLKDLRSDTLSKNEIIALVHRWQRKGLVLKPGSNPEYFLNQQQ